MENQNRQSNSKKLTKKAKISIIVASSIAAIVIVSVLLITLLNSNNNNSIDNSKNDNSIADNSNVNNSNNNSNNIPTPHTHVFGEWQISKNATCTEEGLKTCMCNGCEESKSETIPIAPKNHNFVSGKCSGCSVYDITSAVISKIYDVYDESTDTYNLYVGFVDSNNSYIAADFTGDITFVDKYNEVLYETHITATEDEFKMYPTQFSGDLLFYKSTIKRTDLKYGATELGYLNYTIKYQNNLEKTAKAEITNIPSEPFETISYSGTGDKVISNVNIPAGSYSITLTHNGKSNFITKLHYGEKSYEYQLLTNEIGAYKGTHALEETKGKALKNGMISVDADGYWTITINRVSDTCTTNIKGYGDTVSGLIKATDTRFALNFTHTGKSNFIVHVYDKTDRTTSYSSLTNEIGNYSGEKIVNLTIGHEYFFYVVADGNWTIDFGIGDKLTDYSSQNVSDSKLKFATLKNYITSNGTYDSSNKKYSITYYTDYSSDYTYKYTYYLDYDIADDEVSLNFYSYSTKSSSLVSVYIDSSMSGSYTWTYVDGNGYQMAGTIKASTYTNNTLLGYSYNNISNSSILNSVRELSSIGVNMILLSVQVYLSSYVSVSIQDFGFTSFKIS